MFKGRGWDGVDAHWKARHAGVMPYAGFWQSLCAAHRAAEPLDCPCCRKGMSASPRQRQCPECALVLRGRGWGGIDGHWKSKHAAVMPYDEFWRSLCPAHRGDDERSGFLPFERAGSR
jgi:predicted amidophosphoribosyltransferase